MNDSRLLVAIPSLFLLIMVDLVSVSYTVSLIPR